MLAAVGEQQVVAGVGEDQHGGVEGKAVEHGSWSETTMGRGRRWLSSV